MSLALTVLSALIALMTALRADAQVSPEDHAKHHAPQTSAGQAQPAMGGMMEGMGEMMKQMGAPPTKETYPSLMNLQELTPERRSEILAQAGSRMREGTVRLSQGLEQLAEAAESGDDRMMQQALAPIREGLERFESGLAAKRVILDQELPQAVALQWFKREMSLPLSGGDPRHPTGPFGLSWFHLFVMALLSGFAAVMIVMYVLKMRRAAALLQALTGASSATIEGAASGSRPRNAVREPPLRPTPPPAEIAEPRALKWSGKLRVGQIFDETPDVKTFRLMNPLGGVLPFSFLPGQYLTLSLSIDAKVVRRSYTIASSPTQHDHVDLTVKHEPDGIVSGFLHQKTRLGDLLDCSGPSGSFIFSGRECTCILLIGGGVGITPLMSVIRYLTDRCWPGDIYLIYSIHSPLDFIFQEELAYLQRRHANFHVVVTASHPEGTDWSGPGGRISSELLTQSVPDLPSRYVHVCGPVPFMEAAKRLLAKLGVPANRVKTEAFGPALGKPEPVSSLADSAAGQHRGGPEVALPAVSFALSGKSAPLPPDKVILDVADEAGVEIDNSCRVGTCGVCRVKLLAGQVTMEVQNGLEPGDREQNIILACQAKSTGNVTVEA